MRIFFFIQGEGRGHQTQAIALYEWLTAEGHDVVAGAVGTPEGSEVPPFLKSQLPIQLRAFCSPSLRYHPEKKGLDVWRTASENIFGISRYWAEAQVVDAYIKEIQPNLIINFYEMLCGIWHWRTRRRVPTLSVAHQYQMQHSGFTMPLRLRGHRWLINQVTALSAIGTTRKMGLSLYDFPDEKNIFVIPPLLRLAARTECKNNPFFNQKPFILAYMTHHTLADGLIDWAKRHPETKIIAFWNKPDALETTEIFPNLQLLKVHPERFLEALQACEGLVSTAGFEAIAEAMFWQKPVLVFPTPRHSEQACNAYDAVRAGAGINGKSFEDLDEFLVYLSENQLNKNSKFGIWYAQSEARWREQLQFFM